MSPKITAALAALHDIERAVVKDIDTRFPGMPADVRAEMLLTNIGHVVQLYAALTTMPISDNP